MGHSPSFFPTLLGPRGQGQGERWAPCSTAIFCGWERLRTTVLTISPLCSPTERERARDRVSEVERETEEWTPGKSAVRGDPC